MEAYLYDLNTIIVQAADVINAQTLGIQLEGMTQIISADYVPS